MKILNVKRVLLVLSILAGLPIYAQDNVIDEVIWVVGDEAILKSEVEEEYKTMQVQGTKLKGDPYCFIPEQIAVQKLYLHQAKIDSIEVAEGDVLQRVEQQTNWYIQQIGSKEKMEEYFDKNASQIREQLRENVRDGLTVQKMQQHLVGDIKVTPGEVRQYFNNIPLDSIPYIPTQVEVQMITNEPKVARSEIEEIKERLRDYTERVNKGEVEFSTLARLYSEDPGSARRGGELGFQGRGELVPEFANVAFNLQDPKKVSKVVESEYGFHIIQLIEKRGDRINCRHILIKPHVADKDKEQGLARLDSIADDIRKAKFTFEEAAGILSHDKETRNNYGLMPNPESGTSKFEMQQLPQEVAKMIENMNVGEISKSFIVINNKGKEVCAIVKLKTKINGHKATITEDYQELKSVVIASKREEKLSKWLLEKQAKTYVKINDKWKNCDFKYVGWVK